MLKALYNAARSLSTLGETPRVNKEEMRLFIKEMANNLSELKSPFHAGRSIVRSSRKNQFIIFPFMKTQSASEAEDRQRYMIAKEVCVILQSKNISAEVIPSIKGIVFENHLQGSWKSTRQLSGLLNALDSELKNPNEPTEEIKTNNGIIKTMINALLPKSYRSNQ